MVSIWLSFSYLAFLKLALWFVVIICVKFLTEWSTIHVGVGDKKCCMLDDIEHGNPGGIAGRRYGNDPTQTRATWGVTADDTTGAIDSTTMADRSTITGC